MSASAIAVSVEVDDALCERLADDAAELDVLGIQSDDPSTMAGRDLSPGRARLTLYVAPADGDTVAAALAALLRGYGSRAAVATVAIDDQDWNAVWKAHFRALDIGRRLRVEPPWDRHPAGARLVLVVDPGMAFGTGSHETTRLATEAVERLLDDAVAAGADLEACRLLDVGTGSGLIAMAAVRLGVATAVGVDNDAVAIASAADNLRHNGLEDAVDLHVADHPDALAPGLFDVVVANIISSVLVQLREGLIARVAPGGALVLSGVLVRERDRFIAAFVDHRLALVREASQGDWLALVLRRVG